MQAGSLESTRVSRMLNRTGSRTGAHVVEEGNLMLLVLKSDCCQICSNRESQNI